MSKRLFKRISNAYGRGAYLEESESQSIEIETTPLPEYISSDQSIYSRLLQSVQASHDVYHEETWQGKGMGISLVVQDQYSPVQWGMLEDVHIDSNKALSRLIVTFRGTNSAFDAVLDTLLNPLFFHKYKETDIFVHSGILLSFSYIQEKVIQSLKEHHDQYDEIVITGHSLGGGYATFLLLVLIFKYPEFFEVIKSKLYLITFGSPMIVISKGIDILEEFGIPQHNVLTIVNNSDVVPRVIGNNDLMDAINSLSEVAGGLGIKTSWLSKSFTNKVERLEQFNSLGKILLLKGRYMDDEKVTISVVDPEVFKGKKYTKFTKKMIQDHSIENYYRNISGMRWAREN